MPLRRLSPALLLAALACHAARPAPAADPQAQLVLARAEFHRGEFGKALDLLRKLGFELGAADPALPEVRYLTAESRFQLGELDGAATAFKNLADEFPDSPYAPLALLRAGDANMREWRDPSLDPTPGQSALALYDELTGRYPDSPAAARARLHVAHVRSMFAQKLYDTGVFYLRRDAFDSAILYFKDVIATYPEAPRATDALVRLAEAYAKIGYGDELKDVCANIRRFHPEAAARVPQCPPDTAAAASAN